MNTVIVYNSGSTQKPTQVAVTVAALAIKHDSEVTLLDIEDFTYVHQAPPPGWYMQLIGEQPQQLNLKQVLTEMGLTVERLSRDHGRGKLEALPHQVESELEESIRSDLFTYLRTDRLTDHPWLARHTARRIRKLSVPLFRVLSEYIETKKVDTVFIPNGRVAHQRLALLAAKRAGCTVRFYEIGRALPQSVYIGNQQVHDREKIQSEAKRYRATQPFRKSIAADWLARRMDSSSTFNPFSETWKNTRSARELYSDNETPEKAVFFTSSADEFSSYGEAWTGHSWSDQFEAFSSVLSLFLSKGVECTIRVHPNLINKGPKYFRRELKNVAELKQKFPSLRVVNFAEAVSSYDLLAESDYVFVGRSTLGLEGNLMGKSVWTMTPARYDEVADVKQLHHSAEVTPENLKTWRVDCEGAENLIAYWASLDYPFVLQDDSAPDQISLARKTARQIGQLLIKNSPVHKVHIARLETLRLYRKSVATLGDRLGRTRSLGMNMRP